MSLKKARSLVLAAAILGAATAGLGAGAAGAAPLPPDIATAPTEGAHTALGAVGYREVGSGPDVLLIMGFGASMDAWAPYFVDALGTHFRVILFDNAGIGETASLPGALSVPKMAAQTSALITTLGLGKTNVLGWSMGGLIAQSLAVTHPAQVGRLVLAATQAGTGDAAPVPAAAQAAINSGNPVAALSVLFPPSQLTAIRRYAAAILTYPDYYTASAAVRAKQEKAVDQWFAGDDASGRQPGKIRAKTLVADGKDDALDPVSNDRMLVRLIHGARLSLYPDAGHAFLFQDSASFVPELESFFS
jgi:pimeloyl-ACP methyl ester carboxylesterase